MDRRHFLKLGALIGTVEAVEKSRLIVLADDAQIEQFGAKPGEELTAGRAADHANVQPGHLVFDSAGRPLGVVTRIDFLTEAVETGNDGSFMRFRSGCTSAQLTVQTIGVFSTVRA